MAAAGRWLPTVASAPWKPKWCAEKGHGAFSQRIVKMPGTGIDTSSMTYQSLQRRGRLGVFVQCSTADRLRDTQEGEQEVPRKRRGRPKKIQVLEGGENDSTQTSTSAAVGSKATKKQGRQAVGNKEAPGELGEAGPLERSAMEGGNSEEKLSAVETQVVLDDRDGAHVSQVRAEGEERSGTGVAAAAESVTGSKHADVESLEDLDAGDTDSASSGSRSSSGEHDAEASQKSSNGADYDLLHERIEEEIERIRNASGDNDDEYPLFIDEEDPTWPDEGECGWGFRVSEFFDEKKVKVTRDKADDDAQEDYDSDDEELGANWVEDYEKGFIKDITSDEWGPTVFENLSPVVVYVYERYGPRGQLGWKMLKEVEKMVAQIWTTVPVRAVKIDAGSEIDLIAAMKIQKSPVVLLVKSGKILHSIEGFKTFDELSQIAAHFFYGAKRPSCLEKPASSTQRKQF